MINPAAAGSRTSRAVSTDCAVDKRKWRATRGNAAPARRSGGGNGIAADCAPVHGHGPEVVVNAAALSALRTISRVAADRAVVHNERRSNIINDSATESARTWGSAGNGISDDDAIRQR